MRFLKNPQKPTWRDNLLIIKASLARKLLATLLLSGSPNLEDGCVQRTRESCAHSGFGLPGNHRRIWRSPGLDLALCLPVGAQAAARAASSSQIAGRFRTGLASADPVPTQHAWPGRDFSRAERWPGS